MFEDIETHKKLSKWIIGTFTACILIYLGIRHIIDDVADRLTFRAAFTDVQRHDACGCHVFSPPVKTKQPASADRFCQQFLRYFR